MRKIFILACLAVATGVYAPVATAITPEHEVPATSARSTPADWVTLRLGGVAMQQTDRTCGPASAATVLQNGYGLIAASEHELADKIGARMDGTSFEDLKLAVQEFGMDAVGFEVTLDQLRKVQTWAIVHLPHTKAKHFAVLSGMNDIMVEFRDPSIGHYSLTWEAFARQFLNEPDKKGKVLLILPDSADPLGNRGLPQLAQQDVAFQKALANWGRIP